MALSNAISAVKMSGGEITAQALADLATAAWNDRQRAINAGRFDEALELEIEFERLCKLFQGS